MMIDPFDRTVDYIRISVTDRCDFRCVYCMAENMTFLPKRDLLTLEELDRLSTAFIELGVKKIRLTGGEPLVRRDIMTLFRSLGRHLKASGSGVGDAPGDSGALEELTVTTNGSQLERFADELVDAGVRRINVSVDTLDKENFEKITRWGKYDKVMAGIRAAKAAGLRIKINAVALKGVNDSEFDHMIGWCGEQGFDLTLIETMPLGEIDEDRTDQYLPLSKVRADLESRWTLTDLPDRTGGPARYVRIEDTGGRLGFITPLTHNFCESCNRVRITCTGRMYMCLGQDDEADLCTPLRASEGNDLVKQAILEGISRKPKGHDFVIDRDHDGPAVSRHMSVTGG